MIYVPHSIGLIIATCYKCASNSITNTYKTGGTKNINRAAVVELKKANWKVIGVVRDSIDRFESAYNFFQYGQQGKFPTGSYTNIKEFTDAVLSGVEDDHWLPQSALLKECNRYADLESMPITRKENRAQHIEKATYRLDELKAFYSDDYKIRGTLWEL